MRINLNIKIIKSNELNKSMLCKKENVQLKIRQNVTKTIQTN